MNSYILSIDAGTTGITVLVIDHNLQVLNKFYSEFKQYYPKPGWVEHDGEEIWYTIARLIKKVFQHYSIKDCIGIGIANQRETSIIWDINTGIPIHNAIVWQCKRTKEMCYDLESQGYNKLIKAKTGLLIDSYFSGTKIKWLLENCNQALQKSKKGQLAFGTIDTWILWNLTGGKVHATDYTNAARTLLFNIDELNWDEDILSILGIPKSLLPEVLPSSSKFGYTENKLFGKQIPITGIAGDQQAALFGQGCFNFGESKCTYGTGCFLLTNTGKQRIDSSSGLLTTLACNSQGEPVYALEGAVFMGGAIIQWLRDELKLLKDAKYSEIMATNVSDSGGVILVPAFTGLGAPYWDMNARGTITGLTRGTNSNHIVRAALESIAFQVKDILDSIYLDLDNKLPYLKVDGGATQNNFLMQFQADILKKDIKKPYNIESTAIGAGMLAGLTLKFWKNGNEILKLQQKEETFQSKMDDLQREKLLNEWKNAIAKTQYNITT